MTKQIILWWTLLLSGFFYPISTFGKSSNIQNYTRVATTQENYLSKKQAPKKKKQLVVTTAITLLLAPVCIWIILYKKNTKEGKDLNSLEETDNEKPVTAEKFHQALVATIANPSSDQLATFQAMRAKVNEDILNHTTNAERSNPLEYTVEKISQLPQIDDGHLKLLSILVEAKIKVDSWIVITENAFPLLMEILLQLIEKPLSLELFKYILGSVKPELLSTSLSSSGVDKIRSHLELPEDFKDNDTILDLLLEYNYLNSLKSRDSSYNTQLVNIGLALLHLLHTFGIKAQLTTTEKGLKRAVKLAMLNEEGYQKKLIDILENAPDELLNRPIFSTSEFIDSQVNTKLTFIELAVKFLNRAQIELEKQIPNQMLKCLLKSSRNILPTLTAMRDMATSSMGDQEINWITLMRQKATRDILCEAFPHFLQLGVNSTVVNIFLKSDGSKHTPQINTRALVAILNLLTEEYNKYKPIVDPIFKKLDFAPNLFDKKVNGKLLEEYLIEALSDSSSQPAGLYLFEQLFSKESYKNRLLPHNVHGLQMGLLVVIASNSYQENLKEIINTIDDDTLNQRLFGKNKSENALEYSIGRNSKIAFDSILYKKSYKDKIFVESNKNGLIQAVIIVVITDEKKYLDELLNIYKNKIEWFDEEIFSEDKKKVNLIDYAIAEKNQLLIDFLFSISKYSEKLQKDQSAESLKRAVYIATISEKQYLWYLQRVLSHTPQIVNQNSKKYLKVKKQVLNIAISRQKEKVVSLLLSSQPNIANRVLVQAVKSAVTGGEMGLKILEKVIDKVDKNHLDSKLTYPLIGEATALEYAIYISNIEVVKLLRTHGAHITNVALALAVKGALDEEKNGLTILTKILKEVHKKELEKKIDFTKLNPYIWEEDNPKTLLEYAIPNQKVQVVNLLVDNEVPVTDRALILAVESGIKKKDATALEILKKVVNKADQNRLNNPIFEGNKNAFEYAQNIPQVLDILKKSPSLNEK